jgi:predicted nucleotidyltransferase
MIDLEKAITSLAANNVDYVIVGGVAITLHSSGYITRDLDLCYSREKSNLRRLVAALSPYDPKPRNWPDGLPFTFDERTLGSGTNFTFETTIGDVDLLGDVKGVGDYSDAISRSVTFELYGVRVDAFDLDALIASKTAAGRPKDQLVLPELLALREALDPNEE